MEDKMFELMGKIYGELSEFRKETNTRLDNLEKRQEELEKGQMVLQKGQIKIEAILENDIKNDMKAVFDGYKQTYEEVREVKEALENLASKVEKQEVEIKVIKGGK